MNNAISNDPILNDLCGNCDCSDFVPAATYNYNSGAHTITITDTTVYGSGNSRKVVQLLISDCYGNKVSSSIAGDDVDNAVAVNVAPLNPADGFKVSATIVSVSGCISDGHARVLGATTGSLGAWDKDSVSVAFTDDES